jgi:hypothetical protein
MRVLLDRDLFSLIERKRCGYGRSWCLAVAGCGRCGKNDCV